MEEIANVVPIAREIWDLSERIHRLSWILYTTGIDEGVDEAQAAKTAVLGDRKKYDTILELLGKELSPLNRRRVEILEKAFRPYHLSPELREIDRNIQGITTKLKKKLNTFRFRMKGREVRTTELVKILAHDPDRARRKNAHQAFTQVNVPLVKEGFIELLNLRKAFAKEYGAEDFVAYRLEQHDLSPDFFDGWLEGVRELVPAWKEAQASFGRTYTGDPVVRPWDRGYIGAQLAPEMHRSVDMTSYFEPLEGLFASFGIPLREYNITYDIFPRKNKSEWGYFFPVAMGKDSRILANVENKYYQFGVLLHETGHAVHSLHTNTEDILLAMGVSTTISEGLANFFGDYLVKKEFFAPFFPENPEETEAHFRDSRRWHHLGWIPSVHTILFDRALYLRDVETLDDIHQILFDLYRDLLDLEPPEGHPAWAFRVQHTANPIYLHSYLLGRLTCDMIEESFKTRLGTETLEGREREFWNFLLEEVIKPSGAYPFPEHFRRLVGEDFSVEILKSWLAA
ncbi:MAG: gluzincin family metallopeptidase [Planctomycetota bacterium]